MEFKIFLNISEIIIRNYRITFQAFYLRSIAPMYMNNYFPWLC